jgi:hypothetical protein
MLFLNTGRLLYIEDRGGTAQIRSDKIPETAPGISLRATDRSPHTLTHLRLPLLRVDVTV